MKLRQKLAVVLASAMVVSAVPVVTMADSSNKIVKASEVVKKDTKTTSGALKVKFEDNDSEVEEFYFELTNAEWLSVDNTYANADGSLNETKALSTEDDLADSADTRCIMNQAGYTVTIDGDDEWTYVDEDGVTFTYAKQDKDTLRVQVKDFGSLDQTEEFVSFPLPVKLTGGTASVAMKGYGSKTTITEGSWNFASTGENSASLVVGDLKSFYDEGELSLITLHETYVGSLKANDLLIKIELDDTDFEFRSGSKVELKGTYGFDFKNVTGQKDGKVNSSDNTSLVKFTVDDDDKSTAYLWISKDLAAQASTGSSSLGRIEITGLEVDADEDDLELGELKATIKAVKSYDDDNSADYDFDGCDGELDKTYEVAVANIANYGAYIKMKDEKAVDIVAGRDEETVFEVIESVDDVFVGGRTITIDLEDDITDEDDYKDSYFWVKNDADAIADLIDDDPNGIVKKVEVVWHDDKAPDAGKEGKVDAIKVTLKADDKDGDAINKNKDIDKFKVKVMTYVPVGQMDKKEIKVVADMRGVDEFKEATIANVIKPFDVTFDTTTLKVGLQDQAMNTITIKETDKAMFMKGDIVFDIVEGSNDQKGITIEEKGDHKVEGDLKRTDLDTKGDKDIVTLKRQSKAASTIAIEGMEVTVDRTVPEGFYDLKVSGTAVDEHGGDIKYDELIKIGTANTQDITNANGLAAATATFTIGASTYNVNGVDYTMDAPAYIAGEGYTMIPVRYVANAFGVDGNDIVFGNGTATIFAGNRTIQLTTNSDTALVNGAPIKLSTKVVNKEGRMYVPVGEVANILGVTKSWDATAKTATFSNVNTTVEK